MRIGVDSLITGDLTPADILRARVKQYRSKWFEGDPVVSDIEYDQMTAQLRREGKKVVVAEQQPPFNSIDHKGALPPALCRPVIKFPGAKGWLVPLIVPRLHAHLSNVDGLYVEGCFGSGALALSIGWQKAIYTDMSPDLVNLYQALALDANTVADALETVNAFGTGEARYYEVRAEIWPENRGKLTSVGWAARLLWLMKTDFNGLYRLAQKTGRFNVPWGKRENVVMPTRGLLVKAGQTLHGAVIEQADFEVAIDLALKTVTADRIVLFLDPPYGGKLKDVSTRGAKERKGKSKGVFTGYSGAFTWEDQVRLAKRATALAAAGAMVICTNTWCDEVNALYAEGFELFQVGVRHSIAPKAEGRGKRAELLAISKAHASVIEGVPAKIVRKTGKALQKMIGK